jgi:antitoxin component YwqK of YwqJK toxin-antitoxin module
MRIACRFFQIAIILFLFLPSPSRAQYLDSDDNDTATTDNISITQYDCYNPHMDGDSVRYKSPGIKYTGWYEEYYKDGKIKHKGYYNNGQLTTVYKNYYADGQLERSFKLKDSKNCQLEIYYPSGILRSKVLYYKDQPLIWTDYYQNGNVEYYEENVKSFKYYFKLEYYYSDGKTQSSLELTDKKHMLYTAKEYWTNGNLKEDGMRIFNNTVEDYQKTGTWNVYDSGGNKIAEEDYVKGQLNDERKM